MYRFKAPVWLKHMGIVNVCFTPLGRREQNRAAMKGLVGKLSKVLSIKALSNEYIQLYKNYRSYYK